jgi:RNA polymerase sigma-70 factor, ECF subfamily
MFAAGHRSIEVLSATAGKIMGYFREVELDPTYPPLASLHELYGFVPELFRAQTSLPRIVDAEAGIAGAVLFGERALSRVQKEFIVLAVAAANGNTYCVTEHHRTLRSLGVPDGQIDQIVIAHDEARLSAPDTALLDFALKLALSAPWLSRADIAALRDHGFRDESILEAILVTALGELLCTLSRGLGLSPDCESQAIPSRLITTSPTDARLYVGGTSGPYLRTVELNPEAFPPFAFFLKRFGSIPNLFRAQTLRPDVIAAEARLFRNVLEPEDLLSRMQKECILLVVSAANLNTYCVAAHCEMLRAMGVSMDESDQIAVDHHQAGLSEANKALLDFVLKVAVPSAEFSSRDIDRLRRHAFTEEHILEALAVTALNNFINTLQMGLGTTPDVTPRRVFGPQNAHRPTNAARLTDKALVDPDAVLVTRVQNGNLDAFEELITRHSRRVYRTLVGIVGNVEEAQDAMQDAFLKAFQHIGDFQHRSKFSTWLVSIASNTGLQRLRERRRVESLDDTDACPDEEFRPRQVRAWADDPEQLYSHAERRGLVESGLMKLPAKYRVVLVLRDIEQLSTDDAAAALGLGIPALKARLFRARLMLREALSPHFAHSGKSVAQ